jgi:hypothetical protein
VSCERVRRRSRGSARFCSGLVASALTEEVLVALPGRRELDLAESRPRPSDQRQSRTTPTPIADATVTTVTCGPDTSACTHPEEVSGALFGVRAGLALPARKTIAATA